MYFVILFAPPLYFLLRRKWGGFILNGLLYAVAIVLVASIFFAWLAVLPWALAVGHAMWHYRREIAREMMEQQAELIASKFAEQNKSLSSGTGGSS